MRLELTRGSLTEVLDDKNHCPDGSHREWFFWILVSQSIIVPTYVEKRFHHSPLIWN